MACCRAEMLTVAVGVIKNKHGEVLISKRADNVHQGGVWEFPGGKVESGENSITALKRELREELDIAVLSSRPLLKIRHDYGDVSVCLEVRIVNEYQGKARGMEGQPIQWVAISDLKKYSFPEANVAIINALNLPQYYPIVDDSIGGEEAMLNHLNALMAKGCTMVQLRAKSLDKKAYKRLVERATTVCQQNKVRLFVNASIKDAIEMGAHAVHLSAKELRGLKKTPALLKGIAFAASCHNVEELSLAEELGAFFAVLSPVCKTQSHPEISPLGWECFERLLESSALPVFALGGVGPKDIQIAQSRGAYGVAGIRGFLKKA